ncbi:hypothetical protein ACHAW5_010095 [Stephanodiscus triporus]|uniref:C2H2-type domain-containing protein n=1 Tax=Stephanodiscus triporus TaxID=2934178 RepID=A0ABD3QC65_9STRA
MSTPATTSAPPIGSASAPLQDATNGAAAASANGANEQSKNSKNNNARDIAHNWEDVDGSSMWHDVQEDEEGNILTNYSQLSLAAQIRQRRYRLASTDLARSSKRLVRHMLRNVFLVLDCSRWSREKDPALPPARMRLETTLTLASEFVNEFYDQNPLGHLGVVICRDGEAEMLTSLGGSPKKHKLALDAAMVTEMGRKGSRDIGGEFSLQNGIEVAGRSLGYAPRYGSREIIVIMSALATSDPGDILGETLPRLLHAGIRMSTVALQSEVHICKKLADATGGVAGVCLNTGHLRDLVMSHAIPPPVNACERDANDGEKRGNHMYTCEFVEMGFPSREGGKDLMLVHNSGGLTKGRNGDGGVGFAINLATADDRRSNRLITFARTGYVCPRCQSRCSDLPSDCAVCGLRLILAPHLARTFHHLFPVRPFEELDEAEIIGRAEHDNRKGVEPNGDSTIGMKAREALPIMTSSAYTPISSISSYDMASFMVSSSTQVLGTQSCQTLNTTPSSKMITIGPSLMTNSVDCDRCCFGCLKIIGCRPLKDNPNGVGEVNREEGEAILRFQCPECHNVFCPDCDAFLHETLHNCPGCLCY